MILLYESNERLFNTNGIGSLKDAISCVVTEELNGSFELEMTYPTNGIHYEDLALRRIIFAKPNNYMEPQPFRIYSISRPINCIVTVNAEHISYDLSGYPVTPVLPYYAKGPKGAFSYISANKSSECPFTFETDLESDNEMDFKVPQSVRSYLGDGDNGMLGLFGGEYIFDMFEVSLVKNRGTDRGMVVRYGKNMTDVKQEENCADVYTGVYPYYYKEDDGLQVLDEKVVSVYTYDYERILPLDLTNEFENMPTQQVLRERATSYIIESGISVPKVSMDVSFAVLEDNGESYSDVRLGDEVTVIFDKLGIDTKAVCIKTEYDAIRNKYNSISLGDRQDTLSSTVSGVSSNISEVSKDLQLLGDDMDLVKIDVRKTSEGLSSKVSKNTIISEINQSPESVTIKASKVNLRGYVTMSSLSKDGTTVIDGSRIKTGTIEGVKFISRGEKGNNVFIQDGCVCITPEGSFPSDLENGDIGFSIRGEGGYRLWLNDEIAYIGPDLNGNGSIMLNGHVNISNGNFTNDKKAEFRGDVSFGSNYYKDGIIRFYNVDNVLYYDPSDSNWHNLGGVIDDIYSKISSVNSSLSASLSTNYAVLNARITSLSERVSALEK